MLHCLSAKLSTIIKSLCIARVLRHFVLVPCEICVVPFGHWKIAPDRNDISLANIESLVESLTHACASLRSFNHGYLSLQKYSLQQYFIKKLPLPTLLHNRRFYPQSTSWLHQLVDTPRHNRICSSRCSFKCGGWAARPAAGHKIADGKRKKTCHMTCLFSNRQLSILPGRFQPSTFDV